MDHTECSAGSSGDCFPRFPLALKIPAIAFVIFGILGLVDIILAALSGRVLIDLNVFGLLIGRGLWRLSSRARWWAVVCLRIEIALSMILVIIITAAACFVAISWVQEAAALALIAAWGGFSFWQLKVLARDDIRALFENAEAKALFVDRAVGRRYQFSLASLFVVMLVVGIVATRIGPWPVALAFRAPKAGGNGGGEAAETDEDFGDVIPDGDRFYEDEDDWRFVRGDAGHGRGTGDGRFNYYHIGYRRPKFGHGKTELQFVVLASTRGEFWSPVHSWSSSRGARGCRLSKPGGIESDLPEAGRQLYEFIDGKYRESDERVTMRQFVGFIRSKPEVYSIDGLLSFAKSHPEPEPVP